MGSSPRRGRPCCCPRATRRRRQPEETADRGQATAARQERAPEVADEAGRRKPDKAPKSARVRVKIDFDGFEQRVRALPGPPGNYQGLSANGTAVFYLRQRRPPAAPQSLQHVQPRGPQGGERSSTASAATTSPPTARRSSTASGAELRHRRRPAGQKPGDGKLDLEKLTLRIQPREEWRQEYVDAWRIFRDWFYDPNLHGVDWKAMRDRYAEMLPYMSTRADLDYLLGRDRAARSPCGHAYVQPGNDAGPKRIEGGLLGAEIEADRLGLLPRRSHLPGRELARRLPLAADRAGRPRRGGRLHPGRRRPAHQGRRQLLPPAGGEGRPGGHPAGERQAARPQGAHVENVRPVDTEYNLRYLDWVQANRAKVDKLSGGRIGYIHLPDTAVAGNRELFKYFYPLANKDALILDDRYNGGGFIPDRMIALISRPLLNYFVNRAGVRRSDAAFANTGPKVALINGQAGSGGDAFPYYFRELKLGPLIGTRTWGGLVGLSGNPPLVDGGTLTVPTFRFLTTEGKWAVENEGVAPDIEVIDAPDALARGEDPTPREGREVPPRPARQEPAQEGRRAAGPGTRARAAVRRTPLTGPAQGRGLTPALFLFQSVWKSVGVAYGAPKGSLSRHPQQCWE